MKTVKMGLGWVQADYDYAEKSCSKNVSFRVRGGICKQNQLF